MERPNKFRAAATFSPLGSVLARKPRATESRELMAQTLVHGWVARVPAFSFPTTLHKRQVAHRKRKEPSAMLLLREAKAAMRSCILAQVREPNLARRGMTQATNTYSRLARQPQWAQL